MSWITKKVGQIFWLEQLLSKQILTSRVEGPWRKIYIIVEEVNVAWLIYTVCIMDFVKTPCRRWRCQTLEPEPRGLFSSFKLSIRGLLKGLNSLYIPVIFQASSCCILLNSYELVVCSVPHLCKRRVRVRHHLWTLGGLLLIKTPLSLMRASAPKHVFIYQYI